MTLSCSCDYADYDDYGPGDWLYEYLPINSASFVPLESSRRKRCCSCKTLIDVGAPCLRHPRSRYPHDDIESRIKTGRDFEDVFCDPPNIRISDHIQCEKCGEIWLNLMALGYECLLPNENMESALAEYHELTGWERRVRP